MGKKKTLKSQTSPGDIFEVPLDGGLGYIQFVYHERKGNRGHGDFVRAFATIHKKRPGDFAEVVRGPEAFGIFFPVYQACKMKLVTKVGHEPLPADYERPTAFQSSLCNPITKKVAWFMTDAKSLKTVRVSRVTNSLKALPYRDIVNLPALVSMMQSDWRP